MLLPRETPVFITEAPVKRAHQVDMEAVLAVLGFERVTALPEWGRARVGDVACIAAPFHGEDWGLPLAKCTWLVAAPEATIYFSADSAFMPEVYRRIRAEHTVDLALLGVTGNEEAHVAPAGFGYGELYEGWIPDEKRNEWIVHTAGPVESAEAARLLGARRAFGYAAAGTTYQQVAYFDRGTHADLAAALAGGPCEPVTLALGLPYVIDKIDTQ
jgi:L-ascorbate metabolism protein UlaG (beta-lactamase superfamily)